MKRNDNREGIRLNVGQKRNLEKKGHGALTIEEGRVLKNEEKSDGWKSRILLLLCSEFVPLSVPEVYHISAGEEDHYNKEVGGGGGQ